MGGEAIFLQAALMSIKISSILFINFMIHENEKE
jgi:hypothetical protein